MNEWSPGGNYIRPETPKHTGRSLRSQWDESENGPRSGTVSLRAASDNRNKSRHNHYKENISKTSLSICGKTKNKLGDPFGTSDPRFKRSEKRQNNFPSPELWLEIEGFIPVVGDSGHLQHVLPSLLTSLNVSRQLNLFSSGFIFGIHKLFISERIISPGNQNNVCIGTEAKKSKSTLDLQETFKSKPANWTPPEFKPKQPIGDSAENTEEVKSNPLSLGCELECRNMNTADALKPEQSQDNLKLVEKLGFDHILAESFSKESLSDSCISTRNASLASEESGPDFSNNLETSPSATRVKKVQNWIADQHGRPEKKQSVVTVIGQTQGSDTFSSALQEIDKRRKLVKQLDKYAVCRKILQTEKDNEISELFAKISCLTQAGKMWFCGEPTENTSSNIKRVKPTGDNQDRYSNISDNEKVVSDGKAKPKVNAFEPVKRKSKKTETITKCSMKGTTRLFLSRASYQWLFCVLIIMCVVLCGIMYVTFQRNRYVSFDLFTPKPKPLTWYEKIGLWIWELFRPSSNYRRTAPWQQYLN